jgi:hypothetical protein
VIDVNSSRVVGATISIENAELKKVAKSNDEGRFEIELPAGTYQLTVEQQGFKKFQFSSFRVGVETCELVNIHLEVAPPKMPVKVKGRIEGL